MWSQEDQDRWDGLRKEARQQEALLNQKIISLETAILLREEDIDFSDFNETAEKNGKPSSVTTSSTLSVISHNEVSSGHSNSGISSKYPENIGVSQAPETFGNSGMGPISRSSATPPHLEEGLNRHGFAESGVPFAEKQQNGRKQTFEEAYLDVTTKFDEIKLCLKQFQEKVNQLLDLTRFLPQSQANHHVVQRLQSLYADKSSTVQRMERDFKQRVKEIQLLPSIHRDMKAFEENAEFRLMLEEQHSLRSTHRRVQRILDQAEDTQHMLREQRERFEHAADGLVKLLERVPVIKRTLGRVNQRRRREMVVLGVVMGFCFFLFVLFR